ncbi:MAG: rhomboid family intramembrane serine protease [Desulfocapsaceae bacterium]|nr:rhomboid family intramembrane serine protease [Desulfocapsaceae bacterium]
MANKAIMCPRCNRLIGSSEKVCSWCGASRSNPWWKIIGQTRGLLGDDWLVQDIIIVTVLFYIFSLLVTRHMDIAASPLSLLSPSDNSLVLLGATGTVPVDRFGNFWSFLTANYLHAGILHIVFNMMALRQVAPLVIQEYGAARMFIIYTLGGIGGFILSYLVGIPLTVGASAAICALIGSLLYYGKSRGGTYGSTVFREVRGWVVGLFLFGFLVPGINNWGHGGGILSGIVLGMLLGYSDVRKESHLHRGLALICAVATVGCLAWTAVVAVVYRLLH